MAKKHKFDRETLENFKRLSEINRAFRARLEDLAAQLRDASDHLGQYTHLDCSVSYEEAGKPYTLFFREQICVQTQREAWVAAAAPYAPRLWAAQNVHMLVDRIRRSAEADLKELGEAD